MISFNLLLFLGMMLNGILKSGYAADTQLEFKRDFSPSTLTNTAIPSIIGDRRGIIYLAQGKTVVEYDGIDWRSIPVGSEVLSLDLSEEGRVYVAGPKTIGYLTPDSDGEMIFSSLSQQVPAQLKNCLGSTLLVRAFAGGAAFLCESGLMVLDSNQHFQFLPAPKTFTAAAAWNGKLILGDPTSGLMELKNESGKLSAEPIPGGNVIRARTLVPLNKEALLINTIGNGIIVYKDQKWITFGNGSADFRDHSVSVVQPWLNGYAIGTFLEGVYLVDHDKGIVAHTNDREHTPSNEIYSLYVDRDQGIWAGTMKGLAYLKLKSSTGVAKKTSSGIPFSAIIREIVSTKDNTKVFGGAFYEKVGGSQALVQSKLNYRKLPFSSNALRFNFTSNSLGDRKFLRYRTQLQGYESEWTDWSDRTFREFTNIVWNRYAFKVQVQDKDGTVGETSTFEFEITPPWYETGWFYFSQFLILLSLYMVAAYARGTGKPETISEKVNSIFISVLFGAIYSKIGLQTFLGTLSNGVGFLEILASATLGLLLKPMETLLEKYLCRFKIGKPK